MSLTVSEYLSDVTRNNLSPEAGGYVLGINVYGNNFPENYLVFAAGAADIKAEILSDMGRKKYVIRGGEYHRKSAVRRFTVLMDRVTGDPLQDFLLSPDVLFGREQQCVFDYVYFNAYSKKGEKGRVSVDVKVDSDGAPDDVSAVSAELYGFGGAPEVFIYQSENEVDQ